MDSAVFQILITGCNGGLGSAFSRLAHSSGRKFFGWDVDSRPLWNLVGGEIGYSQIDVGNRSQVIRSLANNNFFNEPIVVFHCAALGPAHPDAREIIGVNYQAAVDLYQIIAKMGFCDWKMVVFGSTAAEKVSAKHMRIFADVVCTGFDAQTLASMGDLNSVEAYGISKALIERFAMKRPGKCILSRPGPMLTRMGALVKKYQPDLWSHATKDLVVGEDTINIFAFDLWKDVCRIFENE